MDRVKIHDKYSGHCAYCGREISVTEMQIDHYWPQSLAHLRELDNNRNENLMPSCRKCNSFKGGMRPEVFRQELSLQVTKLKENAQFDRALRFGQVDIKESPIVFYFEKVQDK